MIRTILFTALAAIALAIFGARVIVPLVTGTQTVNIIGTSMEPTIPLGSLVYIEPGHVALSGDIVTYQQGPVPTTHRVIGRWNDELFMTQGDNNDQPDPAPVHNDQMLGRAVAWVPYLGALSQHLAHPIIMAFIGLLALSVILWPALFGPTHDQRVAADRWSHWNAAP